ncbi:hypothetical protein [Silvimonas iriomotensis]|uniref:Uncharacterized protein n=1 Tax=Silvimonas iriomotensis TaxID=449662 RepID=A0ABQ2PC71_9NEIS|nr:hypothetical protein [Silvimonas iriomotensis]GGP23134.1 hypothetical protein GCM10010970_31340 [Silvimonas iriomotensis]
MIIFAALTWLLFLLLYTAFSPRHFQTGVSIGYPVRISGWLIFTRLGFTIATLFLLAGIAEFAYAAKHDEANLIMILMAPVALFLIVAAFLDNRLTFYCLKYRLRQGLAIKQNQFEHMGFFSVALGQIQSAQIKSLSAGRGRTPYIVLNLASDVTSDLFLQDAKLYKSLARSIGGTRINPATQLILFTDYLACDQETVVRDINTLVGYKESQQKNEDEFRLTVHS